MPSLAEVQRSNATLSSTKDPVVGVFVGGNSGIGASTVRTFVRHAAKPKVYILARNASAAEEVLAEAKAINPATEGSFLATDASLFSSIESVCRDIAERERYVNFVVFTCGGFSMTGREVTKEGLDRKMVLNFYARVQAVRVLLPLLQAGNKQSFARVVSVLGGGREVPVNEQDLDLAQPGNYSIKSQFSHSITFTSLLFQRWAKLYPEIGFVHQFPGYVKTKQVDSLGLQGWWTPLRWMLRGVELLASPLAIGLEESGERTLYSAVSSRYAAAGAEEKSRCMGISGEPGSGAYSLHWNGEDGAKRNVLETLEAKDFGNTVEEHVEEMRTRSLDS